MIYPLFKRLFIGTVVLLFTGCFHSSVNKAHTQNIPQWFLNTPQNSATALYGSGEATSLEAAKNRALNDMASRISVKVQSTINQNTSTFTSTQGANNYTKSVTQDIDITVQTIGFTNAKVVKSTLFNNSFYLLMQVNRVELFNNKKQAFERLKQSIEKTVANAKALPILEQIFIFEQLQPTLKKASQKALVLNAINNDFDATPHLNTFQNIRDEKERLKRKLTFKINSNLKRSFFATQFIELLNNHHYKVVSKNPQVKVDLNSTINYSQAMGWHIAKVTSVLNVISDDKVVSTHSINTVGRSTSTQQNALIGASREFKTKLQALGLDTILLKQ